MRSARTLDGLDIGVALIAVAMLLALRVSPDVESSRAWTLSALPWILLYAGVSRLAVTRTRQRTVILLSALVGGLASLDVIGGVAALGWPQKFAWVDAIGRVASAVVPTVFGLAPMPNSAATAAAPLVPVAWWLAVGRHAPVVRWLGGASATALSVLVVLTSSRGAWLGLAAGIAVAWLVGRRRVRGFALVACAVVGAVTAAVPFVMTTPAGIALAEWLGRDDRWQVYVPAATLVRDFVFTGFGPGSSFATALSRDALLIEVPFLTYAHHLSIDLWLALGPMGVMGWLAIVGGLIAAGLSHGQEARRLDIALCAGGCAAVIHGFVDARPMVDPWTWGPFFLLSGLIRARRASLEPAPRRLAAPALAVAAFAVGVAAAVPAPVAQWKANQGALDELRGWFDRGRAEALRATAAGRFEDALDRDPGNLTARWRLGRQAMAEARFEEAVAHLSAARSSAPANPTIRKALGLALTWAGRDDEAAAQLAGFTDIVGELNTFAHWRETRGEPTLALRAYRVSLRLDPGQTAVEARIAVLLRLEPD